MLFSMKSFRWKNEATPPNAAAAGFFATPPPIFVENGGVHHCKLGLANPESSLFTQLPRVNIPIDYSDNRAYTPPSI